MIISKKIIIGAIPLLGFYSLFNTNALALSTKEEDTSNANSSVEIDDTTTYSDNVSMTEELKTLELHENEVETLPFDEIDSLVMQSCDRYDNGETNRIDDSEYLNLSHFETDLIASTNDTVDDGNMLADKSYIYHKMLNTIDYFSTVQGSYVNKDNPSVSEATVEYQSNLENGDGYVHITDSDNDIEYYIENNSLETTVDNMYDTIYQDEMFSTGDMVISDNDRIKIAKEDGQNVYIYRNDKTNIAPASSQSVFPQGLTFGYLADFELWNIVGTTQYLNRNCVIIEGTSNTEYGAKQGVSTFEMYVDIETGILLQYKGFDSENNIYCYTITNDININQPLEVKQYEK